MSTAMTPAVTLESTASMNARRVSSWMFAARRAPVYVEAAGHAIEGVSQRLHLVLGVGDGHARGKVAFLDAPGGRDQMPDGPHEPVGELELR